MQLLPKESPLGVMSFAQHPYLDIEHSCWGSWSGGGGAWTGSVATVFVKFNTKKMTTRKNKHSRIISSIIYINEKINFIG